MKWNDWPIIGIIGIIFFFLLFFPIGITPSVSINDANVTGSDTNKVAVSVNDNLADYLFSKLQAGSGITLAVQNSGGDENILISSTGGGGSSDGSCDNNTSCILTGKLNSGFDANVLDLNVGDDLTINGDLLVKGHSDLNNSIDFNQMQWRIVSTPFSPNTYRFLCNDANCVYQFVNRTVGGMAINDTFVSLVLDENGNVFAPSMLQTTAAGLGPVQYNFITGEISVRSSGEQFKDNIEDLPYDTNICFSLKPKLWTDKKTGQPGVGFIAQDLKALLSSKGIPEWMVGKNAKGEIISIDYDSLESYCWGAILDLKKQADQTATDLAELKTAICPLIPESPVCKK